jgi:class 3 adenylate cyclase
MSAGKRHAKNMRQPDSSNRFSHHTRDLVELGDLTVGRSVHKPGWSWSTHIRPTVGGDWCEVRHVGYVVAGRLGIRFRDGTTLELEADDVFDLPPGHDSWVIGDEACVLVEWTGMRRWRTVPGGGRQRALVTLMLTDVVGSTALATRVGDAAWDELLAAHYEAVRVELERFGGHEVATTGDGMLATFTGPAAALSCGAAIIHSTHAGGLQIRVGVHAGEVELVGDDVRGVAVHEAARIKEQAGANEVLISETAKALTEASGLAFEDRGLCHLKGLEGQRRLFALAQRK